MGRQRAEHAASDGRGRRAHRCRRSAAEAEMVVRLAGRSASGSQVTVVGSRLFVGSRNGMMYALDRQTGCLVWAFEADAGTRSTPVVVRSGTDASHGVFRRCSCAGLRARCRDRRAQVEGQGRGTSGRDDHRRRGLPRRTPLRAGVVARGRDRRRWPRISAARSAAASWRSMLRSGKQIWKTYTIPRAAQPVAQEQRRHPAARAVRSGGVVRARTGS